MLRAFDHLVAMCCDMLGVVGSSLKTVKFEPTTPNMSQHIATRWPNARNMLRYVALTCCDRLAGALLSEVLSAYFLVSAQYIVILKALFCVNRFYRPVATNCTVAILAYFSVKETPHSEVTFDWLSLSEFSFVSAQWQPNYLISQPNRLSFAFIPRERNHWAQFYSRNENGRELAIEL